MTTQRKLGRPHKGPRQVVPLKMAPPLKEQLTAEAKRRGTDVNTLLNRLVCETLGVPYPYPHQETLPLQEAS